MRAPAQGSEATVQLTPVGSGHLPIAPTPESRRDDMFISMRSEVWRNAVGVTCVCLGIDFKTCR